MCCLYKCSSYSKRMYSISDTPSATVATVVYCPKQDRSIFNRWFSDGIDVRSCVFLVWPTTLVAAYDSSSWVDKVTAQTQIGFRSFVMDLFFNRCGHRWRARVWINCCRWVGSCKGIIEELWKKLQSRSSVNKQHNRDAAHSYNRFLQLTTSRWWCCGLQCSANRSRSSVEFRTVTAVEIWR